MESRAKQSNGEKPYRVYPADKTEHFFLEADVDQLGVKVGRWKAVEPISSVIIRTLRKTIQSSPTPDQSPAWNWSIPFEWVQMPEVWRRGVFRPFERTSEASVSQHIRQYILSGQARAIIRMNAREEIYLTPDVSAFREWRLMECYLVELLRSGPIPINLFAVTMM